MKNSTFRVRVCHASHELFAQFVDTSQHLTMRQRRHFLSGGDV
ncbi:hypothetical protein [Vibrio qingdaonensis]|nr:hypothetical protein [Vibrio qingdaonensis]